MPDIVLHILLGGLAAILAVYIFYTIYLEQKLLALNNRAVELEAKLSAWIAHYEEESENEEHRGIGGEEHPDSKD
jgi:cell division protein FtsL